MDERTTKVLEQITKKEVHELTKLDIGFLKARVSYLTYTQKDKYKSVLEPKTKTKTKK